MSVDERDHDDGVIPVLVVGAGPVGSTLALELARHGVRSAVVDRSPTASRHPKMDFVNGRSMELLRRLGLAEEVRSLGVPADHPFTFLWAQDFDRSLPLSTWTYPSVDQLRAQIAGTNDGSQPREPYQRVLGSLLEDLGRRRLRRCELVDLHEGWAFGSLAQDASGVLAEVTNVGTGRRRRIRARYVVGCDGANSTVRRAAGIAVDESGPDAWHCDAYFRSTDPTLLRHGPFFLANAAAGLTLVSRDGMHTWTGTFPCPVNRPFDGDPVPEIRRRLGFELRVDQVIDVGHWQGRLAVAHRYRAGSVFVAGDAAHQFFPTGGHGANTGIGDAVDLGWKLAAGLNGWGGPQLLTSYDIERRRVALFNREMCANLLEVWRRFPTMAAEGASRAQLAGYLDRERYQIDNVGIHFGYRYTGSPVVCAEDGEEPAWEWQRIVPTTWPGARLPSVRLADGGEIYDLLGPELTLIDASGSNSGKGLVDEAARLRVPMVRLAVEDDDVRAVLERNLVLVRPDQHVAWRGDESPVDCAAVLDRVCGR